MKYFSLFSGIGGFEYGIQRAYQSDRKYLQKQGPGGENTRSFGNKSDFFDRQTGRNSQYADCVGHSEVDKYAKAIYRKHFGRHRDYGDATTIDTDELPNFNLLVAGFPCQAFSIAGKRGGFDDTRGTLFFEIARILRDKRPRHFLLENVRGLLSHDNGQTFQRILKVLTDLGYDIEWQILNSKNFGVPQNRERVFIIGHYGNKCGQKIFPIEGEDGKALEKIIDGKQGMRVYSTSLASTLVGKAGGWGGKTGLYMIDYRNKRKMRECPTLLGNNHNTVHRVHKDGEIRRLTPLECERLQGFPDGWTECGVDEDGDRVKISDTQRYKCLGNAVTTTVVFIIVKKMLVKCLSV